MQRGNGYHTGARLVARFGIGITLSLLPVVSIVGFAVLALDPTLAVVAILTEDHRPETHLIPIVLQVARRAGNYAVTRPGREMLFTVVDQESKYKAKNFIDTVLYRTGDVAGTWAVRGMLATVGLAGTSILMLPFALVWAFAAIWLGREYQRRDEAARATLETYSRVLGARCLRSRRDPL